MTGAPTRSAFLAPEVRRLSPSFCSQSATETPRASEERAADVAPPDVTPMPQLAAAPRTAAHSVLVVDDEELVGTMLDMMLKRFGCNVRIARNGAEAIDWLRDNADIALVLLDVRMPGLDGPQTLNIMRSFKPQVPCCFMTGDIGQYSENDLLGRGALSILKKPFRLQEVAQVLRQAGLST
jgi:CheY-like chemotaxis protein